jgi:hypothetical protein
MWKLEEHRRAFSYFMRALLPTDRHILSKMITTPLRNEIYLKPVMPNLIRIRRVVQGMKHLDRQVHHLKVSLCANVPYTKISRACPSIVIYVGKYVWSGAEDGKSGTRVRTTSVSTLAERLSPPIASSLLSCPAPTLFGRDMDTPILMLRLPRFVTTAVSF